MKLVYSTLILLFLAVLVLGFYTQDFIATTAEALDTKMLQIERDLNREEWQKGIDRLDSFLTDWDKVENKWSLLINHAEIDNIEMSLAKIKQHAAVEDTSSALAEVAVVRSLLKHIPESETLHPLNIL